jgi:DNA-binding protein HU-beta
MTSDLSTLLADKAGMSKSEIIHYLAQKTGLTKLETETMVEGLLGTIQAVLMLGKKVELRGFGTFLVRTRQPRVARNPATQETVQLDRRFVPAFKPSKTLKSTVDRALGKQSAI